MFISLGFAQVAPIDFEPSGIGAEWAWNMGENGTNPTMEFVANPSVLAPNTSATVAKFTAETAGAQWALVHSDDIGTFTLDVSNSVIKVMVYKTVISNVGVKFEGDNVTEVLIQNTKINEWEELTFDFSDYIGNSYSKLVFIPDFASRSQENIIYWDNLTFNEGVAAPTPSGNAVLDFEADGVGQAIRWSVFENGDAVSALEFVANPSVDDINPSTTVAKLAIDAGSSGWVGAESKAPDVGPITWSDDIHLIKMKVYSTAVTTFGIKMVPSSGGGGAHGPMGADITAANTWQEITLDFSSLIGETFASDLDIIVVHPNMGTAKGAYDIYFDDIQFVTEGSASLDQLQLSSLSIYPNPTTDILNIAAADNSVVSVYNVAGQLQMQTILQNGQISISNLVDGIYFVNVDNHTSRVVKQ